MPDDHCPLARCLGARHSVFRLPARDPPDRLYDVIESIYIRLRKIIKSRGYFPSDAAATKRIWLALKNITADWGRASKEWKAAMNQFAILYADRFDLRAA